MTTRAEEPIPLPAPDREGSIPLEQALQGRRSSREYGTRALERSELGQLLWAAQGITRPPDHKTAPSAGARYPLELYAVVGSVNDLSSGIYHYEPVEHALRLTSPGDVRAAVAEIAVNQDWMKDAAVILVIAAVVERTERKYGRRAERYVHIEVGHAGQNIQLQATAHGLETCVVGAFRDRDLKRILGLPKDQDPLYLIPVGPPS